jgi:channel protein (hemolysin III family)
MIYFDSAPWWLRIPVFLALGWLGAILAVHLARRFGFPFILPLVWGGVSYTVGAVMVGLRWPTVVPGVVSPHELWHIAVLVGLAWLFRSRQTCNA